MVGDASIPVLRAWLRRPHTTWLALAWITLISVAPLASVLLRSRALGPFDILYSTGLTTIPGVRIHNPVSGDQITQMIPWSTLNWRAVHAGQLPLWNPFNALGLPQAFNFQSAPFSLSSLVSYLVPLKAAFTAEVVVKSLIAGTGGLFLGRCLKMSTLAALFAATAFELSGPFSAWLGWPQSGSMAWLPWMLGATLLILDGRRTAQAVSLLALSVALCTFAGHPETLLLNIGCAADRRRRVDRGEGPCGLGHAVRTQPGAPCSSSAGGRRRPGAWPPRCCCPGLPVLAAARSATWAISYQGLARQLAGGPALTTASTASRWRAATYTGFRATTTRRPTWVGAATVATSPSPPCLTHVAARHGDPGDWAPSRLFFTLVLFVRPVSTGLASFVFPLGRILHWDLATHPAVPRRWQCWPLGIDVPPATAGASHGPALAGPGHRVCWRSALAAGSLVVPRPGRVPGGALESVR